MCWPVAFIIDDVLIHHGRIKKKQYKFGPLIWMGAADQSTTPTNHEPQAISLHKMLLLNHFKFHITATLVTVEQNLYHNSRIIYVEPSQSCCYHYSQQHGNVLHLKRTLRHSIKQKIISFH